MGVFSCDIDIAKMCCPKIQIKKKQPDQLRKKSITGQYRFSSRAGAGAPGFLGICVRS